MNTAPAARRSLKVAAETAAQRQPVPAQFATPPVAVSTSRPVRTTGPARSTMAARLRHAATRTVAGPTAATPAQLANRYRAAIAGPAQ